MSSTQVKPAPLSTDPVSEETRQNCDYIPIDYERAQNEKIHRPIRVYADGIYDLFHHGHAKQLGQAKNAFPNNEVYLIVGVSNDKDTNEYKGKPVMTEKERVEVVRYCKFVDEVVENIPWQIDEDFVNFHKIDFIAHDADVYKEKDNKTNDIYEKWKQKGMFLATKRTEGVSTTKLIQRILDHTDEYEERNNRRQ